MESGVPVPQAIELLVRERPLSAHYDFFVLFPCNFFFRLLTGETEQMNHRLTHRSCLVVRHYSRVLQPAPPHIRPHVPTSHTRIYTTFSFKKVSLKLDPSNWPGTTQFTPSPFPTARSSRNACTCLRASASATTLLGWSATSTAGKLNC